MKLLEVFHTDEPVIDSWTFVLDEVDPRTGYHTMLATSDTGIDFSQFTSGIYAPGEANPHLGERPRVMGEWLVYHVIRRLSDEPDA